MKLINAINNLILYKNNVHNMFIRSQFKITANPICYKDGDIRVAVLDDKRKSIVNYKPFTCIDGHYLLNEEYEQFELPIKVKPFQLWEHRKEDIYLYILDDMDSNKRFSCLIYDKVRHELGNYSICQLTEEDINKYYKKSDIDGPTTAEIFCNVE